MNSYVLVSDFYDIKDHEIQKLVESNNSYYLKVRDFWFSVNEKPVQNVSFNQKVWLEKIEQDIESKRDEWIALEPEQQEF